MTSLESSIDLETIRTALASQVVGLGDPGPLRFLGFGFHSYVVETERGIVFRIARSAEARARHEREAALLPRIAPHMTTAIPVPIWEAGPSSAIPFGAFGYERIAGVAPEAADIAQSARMVDDLARFLVALHGLEPNAAGLPDPAATLGTGLIQLQLSEQVTRVLRDVLDEAEFARLGAWVSDVTGDATFGRFTPRLIHSDSWYGNWLIDPASRDLSGVLDFEEVGMGDPALDFATLRHVSDDFARAVLDRYQGLGGLVDSDIRHRVQRHWETRVIHGLQHIIPNDMEDELEDALAKLREGPILRPQQPF